MIQNCLIVESKSPARFGCLEGDCAMPSFEASIRRTLLQGGSRSQEQRANKQEEPSRGMPPVLPDRQGAHLCPSALSPCLRTDIYVEPT